MSRQPIDEFWRRRVYLETDANPRLSARELAERLATEAADLERRDSPSARWVREAQKVFRSLPHEARTPYQRFLWPESMGGDDLPWSASASALELLEQAHSLGFPRPVVRLVTWFWRVSQAAPSRPFPERFELASYLHACEVGGAIVAPISWRRAEARLATGEDEGAWFGEDLGQRFMLTFKDTEGLSGVLLALNPMFTRWAADQIVNLLENGIPGSELQREREGRVK